MIGTNEGLVKVIRKTGTQAKLTQFEQVKVFACSVGITAMEELTIEELNNLSEAITTEIEDKAKASTMLDAVCDYLLLLRVSEEVVVNG